MADAERTPAYVAGSPTVAILVYGKPDRRPLGEARCTIRKRSGSAATCSKGAVVGEYLCNPDLLLGANLEVEADGYVSVVRHVDPPTDPPIVVELEPEGRLSVTVLDARDRPVSGAEIAVFPRDTTKPDVIRILIPELWDRVETRNAPSRTNDEGRVELQGYPCDTELVVSANTDAATESVTTTIPAGPACAALTLRVGQRGCIRGRLVWPDGSPVSEPMIVRCMDSVEPNQAPPQKMVLSNGEFELCGLPRGRVYWRIDADGEGVRTVEVDAEIVDVGAIVLKSLAELRGRVVLADAPPNYTYAGVGLRFYQAGRVTADRLSVNTDGSFAVRVPPGPGRVYVEISGASVCAQDFDAPQTDCVVRLDNYLGQLSLEHVPFKKSEAVTIQLLVTGDTTAPGVTDNRWFEYHNNWQYDRKRTAFAWDSDTHCRILGIRPGSYEVFLCYGRRASELSGHVNVEPGTTTTIDCGSLGVGSIRGRVIDSQGQPIPAARVEAMLSLEGERLNSVREAVTTQDGTFRLEDLDPGVWTIYPRPLGPGCSAAKQARVGRGEDFEVEIVADPPRRLFGRLTRHGEPAPQYYLILTSASDSNLSSSASRLERIQVQADGRYEYPVVVPGEYDLIAARNNPWEVLTRRLTVRSDQDTELDWDVGEKLLRMVFTRHGAPADDVEGGYIYTRGISTDLHEIPGQPGIWCASLDDGPALALLWSRQDNSDPVTRTTVRGEDLFEVAYCAGACRGTEPVSFDVHGSSVVVRCTTPTVTRPRAYLVAVDEFREIWGVRQWPSLAWRDDGDDRRFDDLPAGSRVTIVGPRLEGLGNYRVTVDVSAMAESVITWPPGP